MPNDTLYARNLKSDAAGRKDSFLTLGDEDFTYIWPQLSDATRSQLDPVERQACIERFRRLTPHISRAIAQPSGLRYHSAIPPPRFSILSAEDVIKAPPLQWLVRGVLPAEGLACVFGASGTGKSFLALDMGAAIASGCEWFGHKVRRSPVVYAALEGEAGFSQRVRAWQAHHARTMPGLLRFIIQGFDLRNHADVEALSDAIQSTGASGGLLVIDTLNRATSGADENTSRDMGEIISSAMVLQTKFGGLVLLVHHSGKDQSRGLRGHSSLNASLDASIEVVRTENHREWRLDKAKDGNDDAAHAFRLEVVHIGKDNDGESLTSCVVVPEDAAKQVRRAIPPKSGNQGVAWHVLVELLRNASPIRPPDAPSSLPQGCPALPLEFALNAIRERLACEPKRRTERAQQAITGLQARALIRIDRGYVWSL